MGAGIIFSLPARARGPLGLRPGAHTAQPVPAADGEWGCLVLLIQTWAGEGPTRSGEPTSPGAFLLAVGLVALTKEQLGRPPPSACAFFLVSPHHSVCVNSTRSPVPFWQVSLSLREEDALLESSRGVSSAQPLTVENSKGFLPQFLQL